MCGIAGWLRHAGGGDGPSPAAVGESLRHRGPDAAGHVAVGNAGLVFRRLALVDLQRGDQPVSDERRRYWSVFNGEIYNHRELRRSLVAQGHVLSGSGDAELIPHLYEEHGEALVHRLRGMFAIAVYDRDRDELVLMRDRFGIKPLFMLRTQTHTVFGSEVRAVEAAVGRLEPDRETLWHYLSFGYAPEPRTMWTGLAQVRAGHTTRVRGGEAVERSYWSPAFLPPSDRSLTENGERIGAALADSVTAHLSADVEVGAYLSSGVDSSLLVALARQVGPVKTFSVGFEPARPGEGVAALDELDAARATAALLGTQHQEERVSAAEWLARLPEVVAAQEQPLADPSAPALWFLARAASREVKAVLSGEGADELFGGYPVYRQPRSLRPVTGLPDRASAWLRATAERLPEGLKGKEFVLRGTTPLPRRFLGNMPLFDEQAKRRLLGLHAGEPSPNPSADLLAHTYQASMGASDVDRMQLASLSSWLPGNILAKADRMGMAHSLEVRVPFLDPVVFQAAAELPVTHRVSARTTKAALRAAAASLLPTAIASRPKLGFPVPFRSWLDGAAGELLLELSTSPDSPLDARVVAQVRADARRADRYQRQWALLIYLLWRETGTRGPTVCTAPATATG